MDRKSFFRILPGLFAVKEIAKHLAVLPIPEPKGSKGLYAQIRNGNRVTYNGNFSTAQFKEVFEELFYSKSLSNNTDIRIQTDLEGYKMFKKALQNAS